MKPESGAWPGRRARGYLLGALCASSLIVLLAVACGISLSAGEEETEIFRDLAVEGDFRLGGDLQLILDVAQPYPVAVDIECDLLSPDAEDTPTPEAMGTPSNDATPTPVTIPRVRPTPKHKVLDIFEDRLPANPADGDAPGEATPEPSTITHTFTAPDRPGRYIVRCFTPQDDNNAITQSITIAPVLALP